MGFAVRFRGIVALLSVSVLSACGGGNPQSHVSASTSNINFTAPSPDAPTPAPQTFTATVNPGTVSLAILDKGAAIANTTYTLSGTTAQIVVYPSTPSSLGPGLFTGTITVTGYNCSDPGCSALVSGNSQVISVGYQIPPVVRYVAPYVAVTGLTNPAMDTAIIRGDGFETFPVQSVNFGSVPATFTIVNNTEIVANYPATFSANTTNTPLLVTVTASGSPGPIQSSANLFVINAPSYSNTSISYPPGTTPLGVKDLLYDAQRQALLVAVDTGGGQVLRYQYSGGTWTLSASASISTLSDIALSTDGQNLLALSQQALTLLDPTTLVPGTVTPAPPYTSGGFFKNLAVANDGNAIITTGYPGSLATPLYLFSARNPGNGFYQISTSPALDNSTPGVSSDGSIVAFEQGDSTLASAPSAYQYAAATQTFSATSAAVNQNLIPPALDRSATHIVLNGTNVYDSNYNLLGTLPASTLAVVLSPDGSTAYTFDSVASQILCYNLTASPGGSQFPPCASVAPVTATVTGNPGSVGAVRMAITPDGGTLFLAGSNGIMVVNPP
ncbi:MAG: SMP-30/gluconolactonase/LRE family protein [Acidiferrobacterales bacterium]